MKDLAEFYGWIVVCLFFSVVGVVLAANATETPTIKYQPTIVQALEEGAKTKRITIIVFHMENCSWCKTLDTTTLSDSRVIDRMNKSFVPVRCEGPGDLAKKYNVTTYPTIVAVGSDGKTVATYVGYRVATQLLDELKKLEGTK